MKNAKAIIVVLVASAGLAAWCADAKQPVGQHEALPELRIDGRSLKYRADEHILGDVLECAKWSLKPGVWKRSSAIGLLGNPEQVVYQSGREYWCYRFQNSAIKEPVHLYLCFESFLGLDFLTHFEMSEKAAHG